MLNFRKLIRRSAFTVIFGSVGKRRLSLKSVVRYSKSKKRNKMQMTRRANQGWRNKKYNRLNALIVRLRYGRYTPIRRFIK